MLYVLVSPPYAGTARGVMWRGDRKHPHDPDHGADLVGVDQNMDEWNGSEIIASVNPWFLASSELCAAIATAGLTGLHVGMVANTFYSPEASILANLGELAETEIREFRIVLPKSVVEVAPVPGRSDGSWQFDDDFCYSRWNGDDFSRTERGYPVLSQRAVDLVRQHRMDGCQFWTANPRR
jgi:hypothetical protein